MDPRRWEEIKSAFDTVVELDDVERGNRLTALSNSDPELHAAVESLLAADSDTDALAPLETFFFPESAPASDPFGLVGQTVSHFQVHEPIGAGGMGVVYRAEDTHLGRAVALKFLLPTHSFDAGVKARFLREARLVAALDHPNLCTIYEVGTSDDGRVFLAMALYPGETLKARMARSGAMPVNEALEITRQVSEGLKYAHDAGIVHRDLKPGNVMLLPDGTVKILDFGLAKARDQSLSESGSRFGTVWYMSPEQIRGDAVDARADLWAVGVVLYEMLAKRKPFGGEADIAVAHGILHDDPVPVSAHRGEVSAALDGLVLRLLEKDPANRCASAAELRNDLSLIGSGSGVSRLDTMMRTLRRHKRLAASVIALVLIIGSVSAIALLAPLPEISGQRDALDPRRVAVLYFEDLSPDHSLEYLASGLTEGLIQELSAVPALKVVSRNGVKAFRDQALRLDSIAGLLKTGTIVEGTIQRSGDSLRLTAHIVEGSTSTRLQSAKIERRMGELFLLEDDLAQQVATLLRRRIGLEIRLKESEAATRSVRARNLVFRANESRDEGEAVIDGDSAERARGLGLFRHADSLFGEAEQADQKWLGPVIGRGWVALESALRQAGEPSNEAFRRAIAHADRALLRDPANAQALELRGTARYSTVIRLLPDNASASKVMLAGAEADLKRAVSLDPTLASAWGSLSRVHVASGDLPTAEREARTALATDSYLEDAPRLVFAMYRASLIGDSVSNAWRWCKRGARDFPRNPQFIDCQVALLAEDVRNKPDPKLAWQLVAEGDRLEPQDRATSTGRDYVPTFRRMMAAVVSARAGQKDSARAVAARARALVGKDRVLSTDIKYDDAYLHLVLGEQAEAVRLLSDYLTKRPRSVDLVSKHPRWESLRSNAGFRELIKRKEAPNQ